MTNNASIYECILEARIASKQLLMQECCIGDVAVESYVDALSGREMLQLDRLEESHDGGSV